MLQFALNHMTLANGSYRGLVAAARGLGCVGIELRNDLDQPLFDGMSASDAGRLARDNGLRLLALAEVKRFDDWSAETEERALALMRIAKEAGAEAIALIPRNDGMGMAPRDRQQALIVAVKALAPRLRDHGLVGLIEPLGFATCALRHKIEVAEVIEALDLADSFRIIHDSFHHHLAGGEIFPDQTGILHISAVTDPSLAPSRMQDADRGLIDAGDRLGNIDQIAALLAAGWNGPISFECFSPAVHALDDPAAALGLSMDFIRDRLRPRAV